MSNCKSAFSVFLVAALGLACDEGGMKSQGPGEGGQGGSGGTLGQGGLGGASPGGGGGSGGSYQGSGGSGGGETIGSGGSAGFGGGGSATAGASGDAGPEAATPSAGQKYLLEIHRTNFAWGRVHLDYYITADGNVYRADQADPDTTVIDSYTHDMTEEEITAHHGSGATLVTTVASDVLRAKRDLIPFARQGELLSVSVCRDYGTVDYIAFNYTSSTGHYDAILLSADGDEALQNTAPEAQALADWLAGLLRPDAGPASRQCTYADGCDVTSNCDVADCSVCAGRKMSCIVDKLNKTHCGETGTCTTDLTCACLGDTMCAGGTRLCAGTAASGFSCAPR